MKKFIYLFTVMGLILTGCNPLEDINNEIDAIPAEPNVGVFEYTLTADDYATLDLNFGSFNSEEDAKNLIPSILTDLYPLYGSGSSVLVNYNLYVGAAEGVSELTGADIYQLTNSDYAATGSDAFGFYPNINAASKIPDVLSSQIANPTDGQIVLAKYKQYFENPVIGLANLVEYNFAGSFEGWNIVEESGANDVWTSQTGYVQGNGYFGGQVANVEWLVSPSIDLTGDSNLKFQITQAIKYAGDLSLLKILVSTDYTGDTATATWDEITLSTPAGIDTLDPSEDYDFSAYDGQMINIAFKYESTDMDAGRWRISNLAIKTLGASGATNSKGEYFRYTGGSWQRVNNAYYLSSADYDSMGTGSGQPGQYNNFSSSLSPGNYLPTFLGITFPYAQEDEQLFVIYDYFSSSSGAQIRGDQYTFMNGVWTPHKSTIMTSLKFGNVDGVWVPDNTIRYTLMGSDYTYISTQYASVDGFAAAAASTANYGNFDRRASNAAYWSDE
ncbi:MAG: choice-of-anchor J domain-containing protein, partial [Aquaticitalea sp.]